MLVDNPFIYRNVDINHVSDKIGKFGMYLCGISIVAEIIFSKIPNTSQPILNSINVVLLTSEIVIGLYFILKIVIAIIMAGKPTISAHYYNSPDYQAPNGSNV